MLARYGVDPIARLRADLGVEKILFEENTNYHPGLRRRVSRIARRYRIDDLLMRQDVPRAVLDTLSKKGVLDEGRETGDEGRGTGDGGRDKSRIPDPQSQIPNPESRIPNP